MKNTRTLTAMLFMVLAGLSFTLLDTTAKHLSSHLPVPFITWVRYAVHFVFMFVLLGKSGVVDLIKAPRPALQITRGGLLLLTTAFGMAAMSVLPMAETLAIAFLAPLIVVFAAIPILGERPKRSVMIASCAGFAGVLLIVRPGGAMQGGGVIFAAGMALVYAGYQLLTRLLAHQTSAVTLLYFTALTGTLGASIAVPFFWPQSAISAGDWVLLCSLGLYGGGGHLLLINAFSRAPASTLSPLLYTQLIWQTLAGAVFFNHLPDGWAMAGGLIIAVSGVLVLLAGSRK
jgi:drug/metabolite transporter (DMT)-like permease